MSAPVTRPAAGSTKEADEARLAFCTTTSFSHREQSTPLRLQERTPLTVEKANMPALIHSGLFSPQQALPHADCESHLIVDNSQIFAWQGMVSAGALPEQ